MDEMLLAWLKRTNRERYNALIATLVIFAPLVLAVVMLLMVRDAAAFHAGASIAARGRTLRGFWLLEMGRLLLGCIAARSWALSLRNR